MVVRLKPRRMRVLAIAGVACLATAGGFAVLCFDGAASFHPFGMVALAMLCLAGSGAIAALSCGDNTISSLRLDLLQRALDATPEAQLIVAPDGQLNYANIAFEQLCPGRDLPLDRIRRAVRPDGDSQAQFRRLCGLAKNGSGGTAAIYLSTATGGDAVRFEIKVDPVDGHPEYGFWTIRDVTAHHESETAIRHERDRLIDFLDNAPAGFYSVDSDGRFRVVSRRLAQWLDSTPSEIIASGARLRDFLVSPPADGSPDFSPFAQNTAAQCGEATLKSCRGRVMPAWIGQNLAGSGAELHTRSIVCDWAPEREPRAALKSAERFRQCFANAPVGIALLDGSGRFEEVNRAAGELFGAAPQSLKGRELIGFMNDEDRERIAQKLAAVTAGLADTEPVEVRPKRPGDRDKTMVVFLSRLGDAGRGTPSAADGQLDPVDGLTIHFIDVSEQKNLEIQFAQSQKMQAVGQLAGGVAHDFNNLLTAMIGFCDLLLLRSPPSDPSFADIMQIKQNANRAANLVRQLLAFSRQQTLQPRVLDVPTSFTNCGT
jgi:two-component system, cell cycle sensor histidine kinase and response regulator CckA